MGRCPFVQRYYNTLLWLFEVICLLFSELLVSIQRINNVPRNSTTGALRIACESPDINGAHVGNVCCREPVGGN